MQTSENLNLFSTLLADLTRYLHQIQSQAAQDILLFPPRQIDRLGHTLFSNLKSGGFCTLVVTGRTSWDPRSHYYQLTRAAAKRGCQIERAFLLPHKHCRHDPSLQEHLRQDRAAGIKTYILYVGELISSLSLPLVESMDFGLWDDEISCMGIYGTSGRSGGISEWRISRRPEDLQILRGIIKVLKEEIPQISLEEGIEFPILDLEEPMITTAPIAHELASVLCQGDHVSPEDCSWYHSVWQYLRIFDMVSTPTWHANFYIDSLRVLASSGELQNILISGTADYSMLAHILWAYQDAKENQNITVLDLCETPLFLCRWYSKFVNKPISTARSDIITYQPLSSFDLIVTDAFLTRFSSSDRRQVIEKWYNLLRDGGKVITTVRVETGLSSESTRATPDQADAFRRRAYREARRWQGFLDITPDEVANQAQRYAERMISYSIKSEQELKNLFEEGGFKFEKFILSEVPGEMSSTTYAEVIVSRIKGV